MSDVLYWIWMSRRLGEGNMHFRSILTQLGTPYDVYRTEPEDLYHVEGITDKEVQALSDKRLEEATDIMESCAKLSIGILTYEDIKYPQRLKNLMDPPMVLYYRGKLPAFDRHICVAVVGTRSMSESGQHIAYKMGYELASAGIIVVSGMALGIDGVATCGAIVGGGAVTAVMGCGLDRAYPSAHVRLMNEVIAHGVAISEYPPGEEPDGSHFPVRNRIISGLCQALVVIEADSKSGALITAEHALDQGRAIFAVPGNVGTDNAEGPNHLLLDGAHIALGAGEILDYFDTPFERHLFNMEAFHIAQAQRNIREEESLARMNVSTRIYNPHKKFSQPTNDNSSFSRMREPKKPVVHTKIWIDTEAGRNNKPIPSTTTPTNAANYDPHVKTPVPPQAPPETSSRKPQTPEEEKLTDLDATAKQVLAAIPADRSVSLENLMKLGLPFGKLHLSLACLEAKGYIDSLPGNLYVRR